MQVMELIERARAAAGMPQSMGAPEHASVNALLAAAVKRYGDRIALSCLGQTLSFNELDRLSGAFASWLQHHTELRPGDRIAIQLPNLLQHPVVTLGALRAGLVVVNTNPLYTPREMRHQFCDSGARALVVLANMAANAAGVLPDTEIRHVVVTEIGDLHAFPRRMLLNLGARYLKRLVPRYRIDGAVGLRRALALGAQREHGEAAAVRDDIAMLQYTGGTTGVAKGAVLSHANVVDNVQQAGVLFASCDFRDGEERLILPLPLYHIYAFNGFLGLLVRGTHTCLIPDPRNLTALIDEFRALRPSAFAGINTLFVALCNDERFRALDFSALKLTSSGGMALTLDAARRWKEVTGIDIVEGYGLTETSPVISVNLVHANRLGTIGIAVPSTEVRIVDDEGRDLEGEQPGELLVRGPQVMRGYWRRPEETAEVLSADGWLHTGDIALVSAEGYLRIIDRKKDMILVSGFNVYPNEIEDVIAAHPDVLECAVVGVADPRTGEAVRAFVVRRNPALDAAQLRAFCHENLTGYKVPRDFVFRDELPKSNVGKILRRELRDS